MIRITQDREAGAAYIYFVEDWPPNKVRADIKCIEISRNVLIDVSPDKRVLGIELLDPDWDALDRLARL